MKKMFLVDGRLQEMEVSEAQVPQRSRPENCGEAAYQDVGCLGCGEDLRRIQKDRCYVVDGADALQKP